MFKKDILNLNGILSDKSHSIGCIKAIFEKGTVILPLDYYATGCKKQLTGMMAAPILIGTDSFICVVVVIYNLIER